jgi:cell division septal protein FtsQ
MDARISRRRAEVRAQRRRARLLRTVLVLLAAAAVAGAVALERSPALAVATLDVVGLERLSAAEVLLATGVEVGDPILRVRTGRVAAAVAELPLVRTAEVSRAGPTSLRIAVEERRPVLMVAGAGRAVLVDRDGVVVLDGPAPGLPVIELRSRPPAVGRAVVDDVALANAHRVWVGLSGPLRARVVRLVAPDPDRLELVMDSGVRVRFGRAEDLAAKVRALGVVLADTAGSEVTVIDVRVPDLPTVRTD